MRSDVLGLFVEICCRQCGERFERFQPMLAGLCFGEHACSTCGTVEPVRPEDILARLAEVVPETNEFGGPALARAASQIAEGWHATPPLERLLVYRGVRLGPPTERELMPLFVRGLQRAHADRKAR